MLADVISLYQLQVLIYVPLLSRAFLMTLSNVYST